MKKAARTVLVPHLQPKEKQQERKENIYGTHANVMEVRPAQDYLMKKPSQESKREISSRSPKKEFGQSQYGSANL